MYMGYICYNENMLDIFKVRLRPVEMGGARKILMARVDILVGNDLEAWKD